MIILALTLLVCLLDLNLLCLLTLSLLIQLIAILSLFLLLNLKHNCVNFIHFQCQRLLSHLLLLLFTASILFQMLTLVEDEMILLQKGFATLRTHVRAECTASIGMTFVVQNKTVLCNEALSAELAEMSFRLLLRWRSDLNNGCLLYLLLILLLLLRDLNCLLLNSLLLNLCSSLLLLLVLMLMMNLNLLVLLVSMIRTLKNLINHFAVRSYNLHWDW